MQLDLEFRDRDEPAAGAAGPRVLSVAEVNRAARELLESGLGSLWVRGEISNLRRQASGHLYFTMKDAESQLSCVMFSGAARSLRGPRLDDGAAVRAFGEVTVYSPRGTYQMVVRKVESEGAGALQARFEALKSRLAAEGLFDPSRKRPLPKAPSRIGVVTSPTGAAIKDFLNVLGRRCPSIEVVIQPVRVQGRGAAAEIAAAVRAFGDGTLPRVDVIVVTRGGGSIEDLWEFNEESVARAVAASPVPVVSAVGHEIDFTICDFAADFRAPTPSAAAEVLSPDAAEWARGIRASVARLHRICSDALRLARTRLDGFARSALAREAPARFRELAQTADRLAEALSQAAAETIRVAKERCSRASEVLSARRPAVQLSAARERSARLQTRLHESALRGLADSSARHERAAGVLRALGPEAALRRGFSITTDFSGKVLRSRDEAVAAGRIVTRFAVGEVTSTVDPD